MPAHARPFFRISLLALTLAALCASACDKKPKQAAQAAEPAAPAPESPNNAAPRYLALHDRMGKEFFDSLFPYGPEKTVDPATLKAHKSDIDDLIAATRLPDCDFGVKVVDADTLMPHLPSVRKLYKLLNADAQRCLAEANPVGAGARAAAMLRMAHHMSLHAQTLIELMIADSMAEGALKVLNERIDAGMIPDQVRSEVNDALASLAAPDFLNAKRAVVADLSMLVSSLRAGKVPKDGNDHALSQTDQNRAADQIEAAMQRVPAAWDSLDPQSALAGISSGASGYAQFVLSLLPKTWQSVSRVQQQAAAAKKKFGP